MWKDHTFHLWIQPATGYHTWRRNNTVLMWIQPATGSHTWGRNNTLLMWIQPATGSHTWGKDKWIHSSCGYSPQRALTHGEKTSEYTPHVDTAHNGLSHMGKKQHARHVDAAQNGYTEKQTNSQTICSYNPLWGNVIAGDSDTVVARKSIKQSAGTHQIII